ncbi:MAG: hypothetical protein GY820_22575, partial [Gammaproteobacteria bacterium]|nr:hypothetical protein [Gammaproteobacteria bacterium]
LMNVTGRGDNFKCGVSYADFETGLTVFAIALTSETLNRDFVPPTETGSLSLMMEFESALTANTLVFVMGNYAEEIQIHPTTKMVTSSFFPGTLG